MYRPLLLIAALVSLSCTSDAPRVQTSPPKDALPAAARQLPENPALTAVASFTGPMPTGVTASRSGRIFVCFPRWGDPAEYTVAELVNGAAVPFPNAEINRAPTGDPSQGIADADHLISVQSVVVDDRDRLWLLDTGSINFGPTAVGGPKLVCVDLTSNTVSKIIALPPDAALKTTYLNDIRFDLSKGQDGTAYITDSSDKGDNALIVVDLATGTAWRKLHRHPTVVADSNFTATVEGRPLLTRLPGKPDAYPKIGADGIALSPDGSTLFWSVFSGRRAYAIPTSFLSNPNTPPDQTAAAVRPLPDKPFATDGMFAAPDGTLYFTDYENNAIRTLRPGATTYDTLVQDRRLTFPDTLSLTPAGDLLILSNQLARQPNYNNAIDRRQQPFGVLYRIPTR